MKPETITKKITGNEETLAHIRGLLEAWIGSTGLPDVHTVELPAENLFRLYDLYKTLDVTAVVWSFTYHPKSVGSTRLVSWLAELFSAKLPL